MTRCRFASPSHRAERGDEFITVEAPLDWAGAIRSLACDAIVVDCLTLWLSNTMSMPDKIIDKTDETIAAALESTARGHRRDK